MRVPATITACLLTISTILAEEPKPNSKVKSLGKGQYSLGLIKFDENARQVSFPAEINQVDIFQPTRRLANSDNLHGSKLTTKDFAHYPLLCL